jgi:hypothetical protein
MRTHEISTDERSKVDKVRVECEEQKHLRKVVSCLLAETDGVEGEPGKPFTDPYEAEFARIIEDKYRRMGLKI